MTSPRIYLLYTGQHYDPIVSGSSADVAVDLEQKRQKKGGEAAKGRIVRCWVKC